MAVIIEFPVFNAVTTPLEFMETLEFDADHITSSSTPFMYAFKFVSLSKHSIASVRSHVVQSGSNHRDGVNSKPDFNRNSNSKQVKVGGCSKVGSTVTGAKQ